MNVPFFDLQRQYARLREEIEPAVLAVLESCSYIGGKAVEDFERRVAEYIHVRHAIACGNGTDALMLALRACGIRRGDEVITTPFTFFATAEAIAAVGATPVFADICPEDCTIDPAQIEAKITEKTRAILPVHLFGAPCDMEAILDIARRHGLRVVEDAAQAIGCEYRGQRIGSTADVSCFSFYPTKNLGGAGDGGMVTTNDDSLALILRSLREHGAGKRGADARALLEYSWARGQEGQEGRLAEAETAEAVLQETGAGYDPYKYSNSLIGYNSRLDALQAAVLSVKLKHLDEFHRQREAIAKRYTEHLSAAVKKPAARPEGRHGWHQYVIRTAHKEALCAYLNEQGIGAGTFYPIPLHLQKAFDCLGYQKGDFPHAEQAARETVCLPMFPELRKDEQDSIISQVNAFVEREEPR